MGSATFPVGRINRVAAASCVAWCALLACQLHGCGCVKLVQWLGPALLLCTQRLPHICCCCCRTLVTLAVHVASKALWRGYSKRLRPSERRQWCNKIACGLHVGSACLLCLSRLLRADAGCCGVACRDGQLQQHRHTLVGMRE